MKVKQNKQRGKKNSETAAASNFRSSGTCGVWTWTRTSRLSTPCRKDLWRSRSAGRFPGRASLSSSAGCTPPPASAPACRSWSRSGGRSSSLRSSRTSADTGRPRALSREVGEMRWLAVNPADSTTPDEPSENDLKAGQKKASRKLQSLKRFEVYATPLNKADYCSLSCYVFSRRRVQPPQSFLSFTPGSVTCGPISSVVAEKS